MSLFRLDASIRMAGSHSREIADIVEEAWQGQHPDASVIRRDIGQQPLPATTWPLAVRASMTPEAQRSDEQRDAVALATALVGELQQADSYLFAVPLYNFGVSQHFKTWVDTAVTDARMSPKATPVTAGKPAVLVTVRGGAYGAGTPREGWDHATGWMRRILADVWQTTLEVVETEFTLAEVNPELEQFRPLAAKLRTAADARASEVGRGLGAAVGQNA